MTAAGPRWTGEVRLIEERLRDPLHWRKPRRVFVNSMSDLFHEALDDETIDRVFAVMAASHQHTFQVLTKRPERMRWYLSDRWRLEDIYTQWWTVTDGPREAEAWPLPNVWLGISAEDQPTADERIPLLLQTPAAVRFLSLEPLLGPICVEPWLFCDHDIALSGTGIPDHWRCDCCGAIVEQIDTPTGEPGRFTRQQKLARKGQLIDWVIVGGESGPDARPMNPEWARDLRNQCRATGVPFFMKQITERGRKIPVSDWPSDLLLREFPNAL